MFKSLLSLFALMVVSQLATANLLDDKFSDLSVIEGVSVQETPSEQLGDEGLKSAKFVVLSDANQYEAADSIFNSIDDEYLFIDLNADGKNADVAIWVDKDDDENITVLLLIKFSMGNLSSIMNEELSMAVLCKGDKSLLDKLKEGNVLNIE